MKSGNTTSYVLVAVDTSRLERVLRAVTHVTLWLHAETPATWSFVELDEALSELEELGAEVASKMDAVQDSLTGE